MNNSTLTKSHAPAVRRIDRLINLFIQIGFLSFTLLVCCSCGSTKVVSQTVRDVSVDTVYLSNVQYDSIYIYKERNVLPVPDSIHLPFNEEDGRGLYIKDKSIEYRYKLLRDTVRVVQRDSIPYEVTVIETKEITRPLTWFDHLLRAILWLNIGFVLLFIIRFIKRNS